MSGFLTKLRIVTRRSRAIFSPRVAAKVRWHDDAVEWNARDVPTRLLSKAVFIKDTGSVYFPIAKAANSSMRAMLGGAPSKSIVSASITLSDIARGEIPTFTIVRDPVDRFWSAYSDKIVRKINFSEAKLVRRVREVLGLDNAEEIRADQIVGLPAGTAPIHDGSAFPSTVV